MNQRIKKYLDLDFISIDKNNKIQIKPEVLKICSDFSQQELIYNIKHHFSDIKLKIPLLALDLFLICTNNELVKTDDFMEEFYYHSSLLDRLKSGALDNLVLKGTSTYYEILGIIFTVPIYINSEINTVSYGLDKIEIPKRKHNIENELDAEFARGIMLYQLLNETLKEDSKELQKHLL